MQDPLTPAALRDARLEARLSQRELAARLGIRPVLLSDWELGRAEIDLTAARLTEALREPKEPAVRGDALALARRHMTWALGEAAVARKHLDGLHGRVREALHALDAVREGSAR